jgi:hypothetical protein
MTNTTKNTGRPARGLIRWLHESVAGRGLLSLIAVGAVAGVALFATRAALTDQVTMAQISASGGTLDMVANNDADDSGTAWSGSLAVALTGLQPGDESSGTVEIDNTGDLPYTLTASTSGADASACFSYYFRETSVTAGTGAGAHPVNFTGMGTAAGADATTAAFATAVTNRQLPDAGADDAWETDDKKVYTLTVRMKQSCTTNAASGTLDFTFDATQV